MKNVLGRGLSSLVSTMPMSKGDNAQNLAIVLEPKARVDQTTFDINEKLSIVKTEEKTDSSENIRLIPVADLQPGQFQPRREFDQDEIKDLTSSIQTHGVLQPLLLRRLKNSNEASYEIIAGERRWRAAKLAGLLEVPAIIKDLSNQEALEISIIENIQREDLNPIEEALAYQRLAQEFSLTQEQVAAKVGKERASVANYLRLLKLPEEIQSFIATYQLTTGHAKVLLSIKEPSAQLSLARKVISENLSVRKLEEVVSRVVVLDTGTRQATEQIEKGAREAGEPSLYPDVVERLRNQLGTKVLIKQRKNGNGCIEINYHSEAELDRLIESILA